MDQHDIFEKQEAPEADRDRRAVSLVRRFMDRSREYRAPYLKLASDARKLYAVWDAEERKTQINRANLQTPYAYLIVQEEIANLAAPFFQERTPYQLKGELIEAMQFDGPMTDHAGLQLEQAGWGPKFLAFLENVCVEGTAIQKVPYRYIEKERISRTPQVDPFTLEEYVAKEIKLVPCYDGPDIENVPLHRFYPDWTEKVPGEIQRMRGCVHSVDKNLSELREQEKVVRPDGQEIGTYKNLKQLEESIHRKGYDAWAEPYYESSDSKQEEVRMRKPVELWEYWGLFDEAGDGEFKEYIIVIANGDVVIRCQENFYDYKLKPFVATPNIVRGDCWYGLSELFALKGTILEAIRVRNARLDAINLAVNPMWKIERSGGVNPSALYTRANGIVLTNNNRSVEPLVPPPIPPGAFSEVQELGSEMQQTAGGISGPNLSQAGRTFGRSASGANLVSNIANARVNLKLLVLSNLYFKPLAEIFLQTNAQFISEDQTVKVFEPDAAAAYALIPAQAFQHNFAYEPISAVLLSPQVESEKMQAALPFLQAADSAQPGVIDWPAFFDDAGRGLFGRRVKRFTRSPDQMAAMQAQRLAAEGAVNGIQGAAAPQPAAPGGAY